MYNKLGMGFHGFHGVALATRGARRTVTGIVAVGIFSRPSWLRTAIGTVQNSRMTVYGMVLNGPHKPRS